MDAFKKNRSYTKITDFTTVIIDPRPNGRFNVRVIHTLPNDTFELAFPRNYATYEEAEDCLREMIVKYSEQ